MLKRNVVCSSSFTGASNPGNDGARVFSVAYSTRTVWCIKFQIQGPSVFVICTYPIVLFSILMYAHVHPQVHPMQGMMVRVCYSMRLVHKISD